MMQVTLDPSSLNDYRAFLRIKSLPVYSLRGREAWFPDEYASRVGLIGHQATADEYEPSPFLFDYQAAIARLAIRRRKFAIFADCGLGKTLMFGEYLIHAQKQLAADRSLLVVSPLNVIEQTLDEFRKFYGERLSPEWVAAKDLGSWLNGGRGVGITNYQALRPELEAGNLGCLVLEESSTLKSHYGRWATIAIRLGRGLDWKLCATGTPAPNDRIEYANHAVFLDQFPTVNSFLAKFFVNRGQTQERWELRKHALRPFYRALSHWCIFLANPATYGWKDNSENIPPIHIHIHDVDLTDAQREAVQKTTGSLVVGRLGGITSRAKLGQIAKGTVNGKAVPTNKPAFIRGLVDSWPSESTLIWCKYNEEQRSIDAMFPDAGSIYGDTTYETRRKLIDEFKRGERKILVSKPDILGLGLNLQIATRQVFSGLEDSYEDFYQCIKRSNRVGSTRPLNVHIPVTEVEVPMIDTVLRKADRVQQDTEEQERIFNDVCFA